MEDVSLWMYLVLAILVFTGSCVDAIGGGGVISPYQLTLW